jgi:methionine aminopeptidase
VLAADDMVKIDLGAHIDGYIVLSAHTLIVGVDLSTPEAAQAVQSGRRAAVINAAYTAAEVAAKLIKNGTHSTLSVTFQISA